MLYEFRFRTFGGFFLPNGILPRVYISDYQGILQEI